MSRLEKLGNTDLTALYHLDPTERAHRLADLQSLLETCLQYGMEKDRLAAHTFELVCMDPVQCQFLPLPWPHSGIAILLPWGRGTCMNVPGIRKNVTSVPLALHRLINTSGSSIMTWNNTSLNVKRVNASVRPCLHGTRLGIHVYVQSPINLVHAH